MAMGKDVDIELVNTRCDALVQKSRNYFVSMAIKHDVDDLIFIDDDIQWEPKWVFDLLNFPVDVVSGIYRKKYDHSEDYPFMPIVNSNGQWYPPPVDTQTGLIEIACAPTGFLRLSKQALQALWNSSEPYKNGIDGEDRAVFDLKIIDGTMYSEDYVMCHKLRDLGFKIWLDPRMICNHEGPKVFEGRFDSWLEKQATNNFWPNLWAELHDTTLDATISYQNWVKMWMKTADHLEKLRNSGFNPKVIYDIGACWGEWSAIAKRLWPDAKFFLFEADSDKGKFLRLRGEHNIGVLSSTDGADVRFYRNVMYPNGNSYYIENTPHFSENVYTVERTRTLDSVVAERNFPPPDLMKIDVQGAELDVVAGASSTLKSVQHLIVELQHTSYNKGAKLVGESLPIIESLGFKCVAPLFSNNGPDGDYGFERV
jgi:FkbM family methyltransferase